MPRLPRCRASPPLHLARGARDGRSRYLCQALSATARGHHPDDGPQRPPRTRIGFFEYMIPIRLTGWVCWEPRPSSRSSEGVALIRMATGVRRGPRGHDRVLGSLMGGIPTPPRATLGLVKPTGNHGRGGSCPSCRMEAPPRSRLGPLESVPRAGVLGDLERRQGRVTRFKRPEHTRRHRLRR